MSEASLRSARGPRSTFGCARERGAAIQLAVDEKTSLTLTPEAAAILARIVRQYLEVFPDKQAWRGLIVIATL